VRCSSGLSHQERIYERTRSVKSVRTRNKSIEDRSATRVPTFDTVQPCQAQENHKMQQLNQERPHDLHLRRFRCSCSQLRVTKARPRPKPQDRKLLKFREDAATSSLLKKDLERVAVSTVRHSSSRKANKKRGSSSLRCSEWRAKTVFQQAASRKWRS
jgi:hypothetical protein